MKLVMTPGPWAMNDMVEDESIDILKGSHTVAVVVNARSYSAMGEVTANAMLIKEAPSLLKLCIEALEDIKDLTFRLEEYQDTGDFTMIIQDLETGIAAATGERSAHEMP